MTLEERKFTVEEIARAWRDGSLKFNQEYQRGATWKVPQMQALLDSVFRGYPIPPLFLEQIETVGLGGSATTRFEVVDGQQRIRALADFFQGKFGLLDSGDKRLRLPASLRSNQVPWGRKRFDELGTELSEKLRTSKLDAFVIREVQNPDEVRDLFIRLQSGTALTRQQIRDAWPGTVGPFIERLAGKLDTRPSVGLFALVDGRSRRDDDDKDAYSSDRQFCAQLFCLFLARERDPGGEQGISAEDLDKLYHDYTAFDTQSGTAARFLKTLQEATEVLTVAAKEEPAGNARKRKVFKKLDIIALCCLMQDLTRRPSTRIDQKCQKILMSRLLSPGEKPVSGKGTSGPVIKKYFEDWRTGLPAQMGIQLDGNRLFSERQKSEIMARDKICQIGKHSIDAGNDEYDHYPLPWYLGGKTDVSNGRLVCKACHPRGAVAASADAS